MSRARFALDEAVAAMDKLEDYFGTRFTLPKLGEFAKKNIKTIKACILTPKDM